jgi:activator of HSP90 ATPase
MPKPTKTITQTETFQAKPAEVYEALVDPKRHSKFTGSRATGKPKVGERFTAWDGYISGKHLALKPGERIVQEWRTSEWPEGHPPSIVEITLKEFGNGTRLRMVHSKVPAEQVESYRQGWIDFYWAPLKRYFQRDAHGRSGFRQ